MDEYLGILRPAASPEARSQRPEARGQRPQLRVPRVDPYCDAVPCRVVLYVAVVVVDVVVAVVRVASDGLRRLLGHLSRSSLHFTTWEIEESEHLDLEAVQSRTSRLRWHVSTTNPPIH